MTLTKEAPTASSPSTDPAATKAFPAWPVVLGVALLVAVPLLLAVFRPAPRLAASNTKVLGSKVAITLEPGQERCQGGELLSRQGHSFVVFAGVPDGRPGPEFEVRFLDSDRRPLGGAVARAGYRSGTLRLPFDGPEEDEPHGFACFRNRGDDPVFFAGNLIPARPETAVGPNNPGARRTTDEIRIDYYREGRLSIWALLPDVARRFAFFKPAFLGPWSMWAVIAAVVVLGAASLVALARFVRRPPDARASRCAAACFGVALVHGLLWSVVTPAMQTPDEFVHYAYTSYVQEFGKPPGTSDARGEPSRDGTQAIRHAMPFNVEGRHTWSDADEGPLRRELAADPPPDARSSGKASSGSPLYYYVTAAATMPLGFMDDLDRLFAMRVVSAVLSAFTAAFTVLFLAEVFRRVDLALVVGGLAVALHPVMGFLGGGVNNDNLLLPLSALVFFLLARGFRRGMTPLLAGSIGLTLAFGYLAKPRMLFFAPVSLVAVAWMALRSRRPIVTGRLLPPALAFASFVGVAGGWRYLASRVLDLRSHGTGATRTVETSLRHGLSYAWQSFLPRLWFMEDAFPEWPRYLLWDVYVQGFVGRFGWFQYDFPDRVEVVGGVLLAVIVGLAGLALWQRRRALPARAFELLTYVGLFASTLVLMAIAAYQYRERWGFNLEQTRYLFPCIVLYGGVVALALRAFPPRWRWAAGAGLVTLFSGHVLASVLLTIHRYYV